MDVDDLRAAARLPNSEFTEAEMNIVFAEVDRLRAKVAQLEEWQAKAAHGLINLTCDVGDAKQAGRLEAARDIRAMPTYLGDAGWAELERRANEAGYPPSYLREMRNDDRSFATSTVEAAYQSTRDRAAKIAEGKTT